LEECENRFRSHFQQFEIIRLAYYIELDDEYALLGKIQTEVRVAYFEPDNSALHDDYLDLLTEIDARMAEIMIFYDEHNESARI